MNKRNNCAERGNAELIQIKEASIIDIIIKYSASLTRKYKRTTTKSSIMILHICIAIVI